jgi:hypothetical protein
MSQGLSFLSRMISAESGQAPYKAFQSMMPDWGDLHSSIGRAIFQPPLNMLCASADLESFCHEDEIFFQGDDCASGPNFAWVWANGGKFQAYYGQIHAHDLRKLGYVMWDKATLQHNPLFQGPFRQPPNRFVLGVHKDSIIEHHQEYCTRRSHGVGNGALEPAPNQLSANTGSEVFLPGLLQSYVLLWSPDSEPWQKLLLQTIRKGKKVSGTSRTEQELWSVT